jgi:hypothetical protein
MLRDAAEALALLRKEKVLTLVPHPRFRSLVAEIAGGPVKGSWWAHEKGGAIFAVASALDDHAEVLSAKLVEGRVAFVHRSLWPPLLRLVTDAGWKRTAARGLDPAAKKLLDRARKAGELRLDSVPASTKEERKQLSAARAELERRLLLQVTQEHTESGRHEAVLRTWEHWAAARPEAAAAAARLSLDEASATLRSAGLTV